MGVTNQQAISYLENMKWLKGYDNTSITGISLQNIIDDIIGLLKEHEARVMTESEIKNHNGYIWCEYIDDDLLTVSFISDGKLYDRGELPYNVNMLAWENYGKGWRCWSARPTEEQRKAAKWDETN